MEKIHAKLNTKMSKAGTVIAIVKAELKGKTQ
jgi:hypothetical protein